MNAEDAIDDLFTRILHMPIMGWMPYVVDPETNDTWRNHKWVRA